ncbi:transposon Ty3-I Gag-Pol polyprotein [Trichonephila clavipes]|nr:transposon Ty3-I Gag-Pol polyprotein [Trichonephila clavipes]
MDNCVHRLLTRYAITKALPTAEAPEVAKFFVEEIFLTHGAPRTIITDRGTVFQSNLIAEINNQCKVVHRMTTAYHPQTNGLTERFNKVLADMLTMYLDVEQKTWDRILSFVTFVYNTARQDTTVWFYSILFDVWSQGCNNTGCHVPRAHRIYSTRLRSPISDSG